MTDKQFDQKFEQISKSIKNLENTVEDLAVATKAGFDSVDDRFDKVDSRLDRMDGRFDKIEKELLSIRGDHEDMMSKLSNVAYRFELNELSKRIKVLEHKLGIKSA